MAISLAVPYFWCDVEKLAQSAGFEPARAEPNGFLVHRLNHSATTAMVKFVFKNDVIIGLYKVFMDIYQKR